MTDFCVATSRIWQLAGYVLFIIKVLIPIIIIILGVMDFVKAITSSKDDTINAAAKALITRIIIGIVIFFVPLLISTLFKLIKNASVYIAKADACQACLLRPFASDCAGYKQTAKIEQEKQKEEASSGSGGYVIESEGCYKCGDEYKWNPPTSERKDCVYQSYNSYTGSKFTQETCLNANDENRTGHTSTVGGKEDEESLGGSSSSKNANVIYVGDSHISGLCSNNSLSNCFYCVGGGYEWFTGSNCSSTSTTGWDPIGAVKKILDENSNTTYTVVVLLGTNGLINEPSSLATKFANKYGSLIKNDWSKALKIVAVSIPPIKDDTTVKNNGLYITTATINTFNSSLSSGISSVRSSQRAKIDYCNLNLTPSDLTYSTDGLHLDSSGYQKLYSKIVNCL